MMVRCYYVIGTKLITHRSRAVANEVNEKDVGNGGSDGGSQEASSEESADHSSDSNEYRSDLEQVLKDGVLRDEPDPAPGLQSTNNLPSAVGVIGNEYERQWLNKSENWEKFMNEKNGPRAKLFKKYGDYKGKYRSYFSSGHFY